MLSILHLLFITRQEPLFLCVVVDSLSRLNACGCDLCCLSSPFVCCPDYQRCSNNPEHFVEMMSMYSSRKGRAVSEKMNWLEE